MGVGWELASMTTFWVGSALFLGDLDELGERLHALLDEGERRGDRLLLTNLRLGHASFLWLVDDDPEGGRRDVGDAVASWSQRGFHVQHYYELLARTQFDVYGGDGGGALRRLDRAWEALERSLLLRLQRVRIEAIQLRARTALSAALEVGADDKDALLSRTLKDAARLEKERMPWGTALAALLRAGVHGARGEKDRALATLESAEAQLEKADMKLHLAAARARRGVLLAGDSGKALVRKANEYFAGQEVAAAERMVTLLAPGLDPR
jgi:hypothetical protein